MKTIILRKWRKKVSLCLSFILFSLFFFNCIVHAQTYTNIYDGVQYSSSHPYNLTVVYFVANDVPLDPTYKTRVSALMLYAQNFYKQNMINNGYGPKTFGLFTETANPQNVELVVIHGIHPLSAYSYDNHNQQDSEINTFLASNPTLKTSEHILVLSAIPDLTQATVPFYGLGRLCYALDYPDLDIKYLGVSGTLGDKFIQWYGGMLHELGHGLNLPHGHQTNTENNDPNKGMNLMFFGNGTIGRSPTFINRASCAVLNNCQVFADGPGITYYNGANALVTSLHAVYDQGDLVVSGTYYSDKTVTDINISQDPYATPSQGYYAVNWSVSSSAGNSFSVRMPVSELQTTNGPANLWIVLQLQNGDNVFKSFPFTYNNGIPTISIDFDDTHCSLLPTGWQFAAIGDQDAGIGCFTAASKSFKMRAYKADAASTDVLPFAYTTLTGNGSIVARVKDTSLDFNGYVGVTLRNTLAAKSAFVSINALDYRGVFDVFRAADGNNSGYHNVITAPIPLWLKLERVGNIITSYYSSDGVNWTTNFTYNIPSLGNTIYAGLFASKSGSSGNIDNISINGVPLPVHLISFTVQRGEEGGNKLAWSTASEENNAYFEIERSTDARVFQTLDRVEGHGTSKVENNYVFTDNNPSAGTHYYRLKQIDLNGTFEYSRIIQVKNGANPEVVTLYPNPSYTEMQVKLQGAYKFRAVTVYNILGREVLHQDGSSNILRIGSLEAGLYIVEIELAAGQILRQQITKR